MKHVRWALVLLLFPLLIAACANEESAVPQGLQGPALLMFYTGG